MRKRCAQSTRTDSRGRVNLGMSLANRTLIVQQRKGEFVLRAVPEREVWLYKNKAALESVRRGLEQARARKFIERDQSIVRGKLRGRGA